MDIKDAWEIVKEVFNDDNIICYPGSNFNMIIGTSNGIYNYTKDYVDSFEIRGITSLVLGTSHNSDLKLSGSIYVNIETKTELVEYLKKVNGWMEDRMKTALKERHNNRINEVLKNLD